MAGGLPRHPLPPAHAPVAPHPAARVSATATATAQTPPPPQAPAISPETKARLDQLEVQIDGLDSRAAAVNNSLNNMQRSMQKDGMALRGDMVAKQAGMNSELAKAHQAFAQKDADRADRFAGLAQDDITALEHFLGR